MKKHETTRRNRRHFFIAAYLFSLAFVIWASSSHVQVGDKYVDVPIIKYLEYLLANQNQLFRHAGGALSIFGIPYLLSLFVAWIEKLLRKFNQSNYDALQPESGPRLSLFVAFWMLVSYFWYMGTIM